MVTAIPNRFESYFSPDARERARRTIGDYVARLAKLAARPGTEVYFMTRNHAKVIVCDDLVYVGSSNFSDESAENVEAGLVVRDEDAAESVGKAVWDALAGEAILHPAKTGNVVFWAQWLKEWIIKALAVEAIDFASQSGEAWWTQRELLDSANRVVAVAQSLLEVHDESNQEDPWPAPVVAVVKTCTDENALEEIVAEIEWESGPVQKCIKFSQQSVIDRHVAAECSDEETLEEHIAAGELLADEEWEAMAKAAAASFKELLEKLAKQHRSLLEGLKSICRPVDNTKV